MLQGGFTWLKNSSKKILHASNLRRYQFLTACLSYTLRRQVKKSSFQVTSKPSLKENIKTKTNKTNMCTCGEHDDAVEIQTQSLAHLF